MRINFDRVKKLQKISCRQTWLNWIMILKFLTNRDRKCTTSGELVFDSFGGTSYFIKGKFCSGKLEKDFTLVRQPMIWDEEDCWLVLMLLLNKNLLNLICEYCFLWVYLIWMSLLNLQEFLIFENACPNKLNISSNWSREASPPDKSFHTPFTFDLSNLNVLK